MTRFTSRTVTEATTAASVGVNIGCGWSLIFDFTKYSGVSEHILGSAILQLAAMRPEEFKRCHPCPVAEPIARHGLTPRDIRI